MKNKYNKRKYKLQTGVQQIQMDTPDYGKAYEIQAEQSAKNKGISQVAQQFSGSFAPAGQVGGMAADVIRNRAKNKKTGSVAGGAVEMGSSGAALGMQLGGPWGAAAGAVVGGVYGGIKGAKDYEKIKAAAQAEEKRVEIDNFNKTVKEGASTDAQSNLNEMARGATNFAQKGKYKVKTKQPRLIETEGREPIFSPKKSDGTRDLLYYNPNDPTHEEGGVKAMVIPKAQNGKQRTVAQPSSTAVLRTPKLKFNKNYKKIQKMEGKALQQDIANKDKSLKSYKNFLQNKNQYLNSEKEKSNLRSELDEYRNTMSGFSKWEDVNYNSFNDFLETVIGKHKNMSPEERNKITRKSFEEWKTKNPQEDPSENIIEMFDRTGLTSWDDVKRFQAEDAKRQKENPNEGKDKLGALMEVASAIPGGKFIPFKGTTSAVKNTYNKVRGITKQASDIGEKVFTPTIGTLNKLKKVGKGYINKGLNTLDEIGDYSTLAQMYDSYFGNNKVQEKVFGAKQLKVNDLNNTAFSQNLSSTPSANAANTFFQPQTGINQVARQIPQERRQEKINTPRSHKKSVGPVKTVEPPMLYEMKPPPPRSTFNTKNDFKKGGKYIKVYKEGTDGTEPGATYKHTKTFKSKPAYQAALQAHDDSLNLYSQSRYFTDLVKGSGLYNSTIENPEVKNITRSGLGRAQSPLKAYGAPNEYTEEIMSVAGMNPMRKDLYSRKESQYKSFKEWEEAKASGQPHSTHEGYEINMYKHPEMALNFQPDTAEVIQPRRSKFKTSSDSSTTKTPVRPIQVPTRETVADTSKTKTTPVVANKPVATRGKFVGREKTLLDKAGEFLNKVGSSKRMSNGKSVRVFK